MRPRTTISIGLLIWLAFGVVVLGLTLPRVDSSKSDFALFYDGAMALREGRTPTITAYANLNPPTFTLLVVPFANLPLRTSFWVWTVAGVFCIVISLALAARRWPASRLWWIVGGLAATTPALYGWVLGQVTWLLLVLVTLAWRQQSGIWLGVAIALKPPLAVAVLFLPFRIGVQAALSAIVLTAAAIATTGLGPWRDWLALSERTSWIALPHNVSIFGLLARLTGGGTIAELWWVIPLAGLILLAGAWWARGQRDDVRWLAAIWGTLLTSPLGWSFYLPVALGPLGVLWRSNRWTVTALVLFTLPLVAIRGLIPNFDGSMFLVMSASSVATVIAIVGLWPASSRRPHAQQTQR